MKETDLRGMNAADAKAHIAQYLTTLRLTEKQLEEAKTDTAKWRGRVELARSSGREDLARAAEEEAGRCQTKADALSAEIAELRGQIADMRLQVPTLAAYERSVDPDLLEQELLIVAGHNPGDEASVETSRKFSALERETGVDAELAALKAKLSAGASQEQDV